MTVDFDALAQALGSDAPRAIREAAFAARSAAIDRVIRDQSPAWVIHTRPTPADIDRYRSAGAEFIVLDPGMDVCLERTKGRPDRTPQAIRDWYDDPPHLEPADSSEPPKGRAAMDYKFAPFRVKEAGPSDGLKDGQFTGYASVFGNVDSYGDIVDKGAFARTLAEWAEKDGTIPVLWGHDMHDPFANIGGVIEATEDDHGLKIVAELDLDNPTAAQVYRLIKGRRTNTMSFAYAVKGHQEDDEGLHLTDLDLFEVSVVQVPANERAEITAVKRAAAALTKEGRELSTENEDELRSALADIDGARAAIAAVLESGEEETTPDGEEDQEEASGAPEAKSDASDEEPTGAKSSVSDEEPKANPSARVLAAMFDTYAAAYGGERSV